ncbi:MAG: hypothetical protein PSN34_06990 [Urechidicola sp.]|nr:hypothetical protein [Urechidicola sp.]
MNKNTILILTFFVVLVVLLWLMPNQKVESIGDFFEKIIKPLSYPLSAIILINLGLSKYKHYNNKDKLK